MATPILATKLFVPVRPPTVVRRPRLVDRLCEGLAAGRKLTLISAPAGSGKTTLASAWLTECQLPLAWLSLEEGDSDAARFLSYLVAALRTVAPALGEGVLRALDAAQPGTMAVEAALNPLLNDVAAIPDPFVLVLDDYHVLDAQAIDDAVAFLIEHQPPHMHLVIATREDPRLPLARLRARGQLTELRAANLRFTTSEAAEFLNQAMNLSLSADAISALEDRTEGWIAGLQLASIALRSSTQSPQDIPEFIRAFAGDHRYILDYLVEEVLQRQPESVRSFLLQTAILDRLNGSLCDAVTGQQNGSERLAALERGNFFVIRLDDKHRWYRFHHLFAEVLRAFLTAEQGEQLPTLHRRASEWYEQHRLPSDAIRHALAAQDFGRAANLIELAIPAMRRSRQEATLLGWLRALPDELIRSRPLLSAYYAGALLAGGELEGVEARLQDAERWLPKTAGMTEQPAGMVVVDEEEFRRLPGSIAVFRAAIAMIMGNVPGTVEYARRALKLAPEDDHVGRAGAAGFLGFAYWRTGDLEAAHRAFAECMARLQRAGYLSDALGSAFTLADLRITQGRLRDARSTYERGLQLAAHQGGPPLLGTADLYVGLSEIARERNDLDTATRHLQASKELGEHAGLPQNRHRGCVAMARLREAQGDVKASLELLDEAERRYLPDFFPNVHPIPALRARDWIKQGRLDEALEWAREQGVSAQDDLSYLREFEHITLARVLLARYRGDRADASLREAMGLLARLLKAAEAGGRTGSAIEILVLQALAHEMQGDVPHGFPAALAALRQALALAEPEGYVRIFVDENLPMAALLEKAREHNIAPNYVRRLLGAFSPAGDKTSPGQASIGPLASGAPAALIEPLSEREFQVLRLLATDLSGPEIAGQLMVSLNTLRTHTKNIYGKLGANSRRAAVRRAEELDLL